MRHGFFPAGEHIVDDINVCMILVKLGVSHRQQDARAKNVSQDFMGPNGRFPQKPAGKDLVAGQADNEKENPTGHTPHFLRYPIDSFHDGFDRIHAKPPLYNKPFSPVPARPLRTEEIGQG